VHVIYRAGKAFALRSFFLFIYIIITIIVFWSNELIILRYCQTTTSRLQYALSHSPELYIYIYIYIHMHRTALRIEFPTTIPRSVYTCPYLGDFFEYTYQADRSWECQSGNSDLPNCFTNSFRIRRCSCRVRVLSGIYDNRAGTLLLQYNGATALRIYTAPGV